MKRCSYCGAEYSEDADKCVVDHSPLQSNDPSLAPAKGQEISQSPDEIQPAAPNYQATEVDLPGYFRCLWRTNPVDAEKLLEQFAGAGILFKIEPVVVPQQQTEMFFGYPPIPRINVYVHLDDKEKAMKIVAADWKV